MDLSPKEFKVLKSLSEDWKSLEDISKETGLSEFEVLRLLGFLQLKKLAELKEEEITEIQLTDLGRKYLEIGLPERRLQNLVKDKKEITLKDLKDLFEKDEFSIALGKLKERGAIEIRSGKVMFIKEVDFPEEKLLEKISTRSANLEEIKPLLTRKKLIDISKKKIYRARVTEKGKEVSEKQEVGDSIIKYTKNVLVNKEWKSKKFKEFDLNIPVKPSRIGKKHFYLKILDKIRQELISMGFEEMDSYSLVASHFWNLDALFVSQDHPVGELSLLDTFIVDYPEIKDFPEELKEKVKETHLKCFGKWDDNLAKIPLMTSQITMVSARMLPKIKIPGKYFLIEKVFRYDTIDKSHFIEFYQLEGILAEEKITFGELLGLLKDLISNIFKIDKVKFYPGYFPFTEPSVEAYAKHPELGWIEVGGAGIFREELLEPFGIKTPVIAWGLGFDRLVMISLGINDIRDLHTRDLRKLIE